MYKVVIIDDEPIIVEGLMRVVPWETFNCRVAATAGDGEEGTRAIREHHPDILITDIRMPNLDGLTMLSGIRSEFPEMQITVLTGFRDFTYAQEAIRLGVTRFLVKPSKMSEIEEALKTMAANLVKQGNKGTDIEKGEHQSETNEAANNFVVRQAIAYIEAHYKEKISLGEIADKVYVSQWHLSKLLNKHTNKNFYDILNDIRIREAKRLLSNPSLRISEISEMVGYIDQAHFSRIFKKLEGISANEYRNKMAVI
jgi:Response regulator containing CheY-like receiver domain and AraC-type DNA-binding domain